MLNSLWTPTTLGGTSLPHRRVMAPMTRDRSTPEGDGVAGYPAHTG